MDATRGGDSPRQEAGHGAVVEFRYRLTAADFEEALRARARRSPVGRAQVLMGPVVAGVTVVAASIFKGATLPEAIAALVLVMAAVFWGAVRGLRNLARRLSGVMEPFGQCHMVADDHGTVTTGERASNTLEWSVFRDYLETPGLFVLLGGDRTSSVTVLPKRGAEDDTDVDRLRAVLDRKLKRL